MVSVVLFDWSFRPGQPGRHRLDRGVVCSDRKPEGGGMADEEVYNCCLKEKHPKEVRHEIVGLDRVS